MFAKYLDHIEYIKNPASTMAMLVIGYKGDKVNTNIIGRSQTINIANVIMVYMVSPKILSRISYK